MKKASLVIPTKDKLSRLRLVLKALESQVNEAVEVLVIFDGCNQETLVDFQNLQLSFTPVTIVHEQNLGRARARNSGIGKASGEIVIFLDDDRIPGPGFVEGHIKRHEKGRYAVIGERNDLNYPEAMLETMYYEGFTPAVFERMEQNAIKEPNGLMKKLNRRIFGSLVECVTFSTGNSSARRRDLLEIGMFDEGFSGWGVEDMDLGYRLIKSGVKVIRDYSIVNYHLVHPVDRTRQVEEYWRNLNYFLNKIKDDKMAVLMAKLLSVIIYR
jgi:GT2 family glycosyltransferase